MVAGSKTDPGTSCHTPALHHLWLVQPEDFLRFSPLGDDESFVVTHLSVMELTPSQGYEGVERTDQRVTTKANDPVKPRGPGGLGRMPSSLTARMPTE